MQKASRRIKLAVFDVDGVLVPIKSSWQYVHEKLGTVDAAKRNYELFLKGRIGYWEWMYLDTLAWIEAKPGITIWDLLDIFRGVEVCPEAICAASKLREAGVLIALVSGGINLLVERVARILGASYAFSPKLSFDYYGRLVPGGEPIVEADGKDKIVYMLAREIGIDTSEVAFVGDSFWDVKGMKAAGLSIAVNTSDERVLNVANIVASNACDAATKILES